MRSVGVGHYENFPVASWLCPPALRAPIRAIYAFARTADDLADEGAALPAERLADLARYRAALAAVCRATAHGDGMLPTTPWPSVFGALAAALREHALSPALLHALLDAFEQDVHNPAYADRAALLDYCHRSANPIGRLLLQLYGIDDETTVRQSDALCSALQLINFWQDLSVDMPRGRVYVPRADAQRFGVDLSGAGAPRGEAVGSLVRELVHWAAALMIEGAALPQRIPGRAGWELRLVVHGGWRILEKIARMNFRSTEHRPRLHAGDAALLLWRSLFYGQSWFSLERLR